MSLDRIPLAIFLLGLWSATSSAQTTELISVATDGGSGNSASEDAAVSSDGRYVAFSSRASDLVSGANNGKAQIFVRDTITGTTEHLSKNASDVQADENCYSPAISEDGRYVAFQSYASNLIADDTNAVADVYVYDRTLDVMSRVSITSTGDEANGASGQVGISRDGRFVVFESRSSNLVPSYSGTRGQIYLHDRDLTTTEIISIDDSGVAGDFHSSLPSVSDDGRYVSFESRASNLIASDTNNTGDVFVRDRTLATTERVSVSSDEVQANAESDRPDLSADGRYVAFFTWASNLVSGDSNVAQDVLVRDRTLGTTTRVSLSTDGDQGNANSGGFGVAISPNGRHVAFTSDATNLVSGDTNSRKDIFVHDRVDGRTVRVSLATDGTEAEEDCFAPSLSEDGRYVAFETTSQLDGSDPTFASDIYRRDWCPANWSLYGAGYPGTLGIPTIACSDDPRLGETITLDIGNSLGASTGAALFLGYAEASLPGAWGGSLLLIPALVVPLGLPAGGLSLPVTMPDDSTLCGLELYLQALESDPGASASVSATEGLSMRLGS